jgi:hypothetical protein
MQTEYRPEICVTFRSLPWGVPGIDCRSGLTPPFERHPGRGCHAAAAGGSCHPARRSVALWFAPGTLRGRNRRRITYKTLNQQRANTQRVNQTRTPQPLTSDFRDRVPIVSRDSGVGRRDIPVSGLAPSTKDAALGRETENVALKEHQQADPGRSAAHASLP